jgi:hypothetical protein
MSYLEVTNKSKYFRNIKNACISCIAFYQQNLGTALVCYIIIKKQTKVINKNGLEVFYRILFATQAPQSKDKLSKNCKVFYRIKKN